MEWMLWLMTRSLVASVSLLLPLAAFGDAAAAAANGGDDSEAIFGFVVMLLLLLPLPLLLHLLAANQG